MKWLPLCCLGLSLSLVPVFAFAQHVAAITFTHVNVIDATGAPEKQDMTVVIRGNRITAIGKTGHTPIPKESTIINAAHRYMIPGLWDMHVHNNWNVRWATSVFLPLYLVNGVTGIRDMGGPESGDPDTVFRRRKEIEDGTLLGPRLVAAGYMFFGPVKGSRELLATTGDSDSRRAVDFVKEAGADFIKVKELVPRESYFSIADEAKKQHIPLVGHVPTAIDAVEATDAGQRSIEHTEGIWFACSLKSSDIREEARNEELKMFTGKTSQAASFRTFIAELNQVMETFSMKKAREVFDHMAHKDVWVCPTLVATQSLAYIGDSAFRSDARLQYMPRVITISWEPKYNGRTKVLTPEDYAVFRLYLDRSLELVRMMEEAGVKIVAGTDIAPSMPYLFPGFSLQDELILYVKAGLTPMEAIQTATRNSAQLLGMSRDLGTIQKGKIADLVLLEADPLASITNIRKIDAVITNGRLLDQQMLQQMLEGAKDATKNR